MIWMTFMAREQRFLAVALKDRRNGGAQRGRFAPVEAKCRKPRRSSAAGGDLTPVRSGRGPGWDNLMVMYPTYRVCSTEYRHDAPGLRAPERSKVLPGARAT